MSRHAPAHVRRKLALALLIVAVAIGVSWVWPDRARRTPEHGASVAGGRAGSSVLEEQHARPLQAPAPLRPAHDAAVPGSSAASQPEIASQPLPHVAPANDGASGPAASGASQEAADGARTPRYWGRSHNDALHHVLRSDESVAWNGSASARLAPGKSGPLLGLSTIEQIFAAAALRGKRVRYSARLKTAGTAPPGGAIWFRAEDAHGEIVAFQNTEGQLAGDMEWTEHSIVIDIPTRAAVVLYGAFLIGPGSLWFDDAHIEVVERIVPLTGGQYPAGTINVPPEPRHVLPGPANLDFEELSATEHEAAQ